MRRIPLWLACALVCACGDDAEKDAGAPAVSERAVVAPEAELDTDPPMPSAGTVLERANGLRISIETAGKGRAARVGRTVVFHQRTRALPKPPASPAAPSAALETSEAVASATVVEPTPQSAPASDAETASDVAATDGAPAVAIDAAPAVAIDAAPDVATAADPIAAAESQPSEPVEISSTWRSGVPLSAVLGRGQLIPGLEQALDGVRAGSRLSVHVPAALCGAPADAPDAAASALEIEIEVVEVR